MQTDVRAASASSDGTIIAARTRVKGLLVVPGASAGSITLKDGGSSGVSQLTITTLAAGTPFPVVIPGEGVLFETDVYGAVSNAEVTVFYG